MTLYAPSAYDLIPAMSDYTNGSVTVSGNNYWLYNSLPYYPWKAFNNSVETQADAWMMNAKTGWLKVDFGAPTTVNAYTISAFMGTVELALTNMPRDFRLMGNNTTNAVYDTLLDVQSGVIDWTDKEMKTYELSTPAAYRYYTLMINSTNGLFCIVGEFGLRSNQARITGGISEINMVGNADIATPTITASSRPGVLAAIRGADPYPNIMLPISSFSVKKDLGVTKYIQIVVPGTQYAEEIADRASGVITLYRADGVLASEMGSLPISAIRIDEGANSQSITLQANI